MYWPMLQNHNIYFSLQILKLVRKLRHWSETQCCVMISRTCLLCVTLHHWSPSTVLWFILFPNMCQCHSKGWRAGMHITNWSCTQTGCILANNYRTIFWLQATVSSSPFQWEFKPTSAVTKEGNKRFDIIFPKYKKGGYIVRNIRVDQTYSECKYFVLNNHVSMFAAFNYF